MQWGHHHHIHWNSHHLLHWQSHRHLPWYLHVHRHSHGSESAGAYVGRVGSLAIALGIGTAVAGGFCAACASADATANAADDTSTSQSVDAGPARSAPVNSATTASRHTGSIRLGMPDSVMAPARSPQRDKSSADTIASPPPASVPGAATAVALSKTMSVDKVDKFDGAATAAMARTPRLATQVAAAAAKAASVASASSATTTVTESERMVVSPTSAARIVSDRKASGGSALAISSSATASMTLTVPTSTTGLTIRAKTAAGAPNMTVAIDGVPVTTLMVTPTGWTDFTFAGVIPAGSHVVSISTTTATSRNVLYIDKMSTFTGPIKDDFTGKAGSAPNDALWGVRSGSGFDSGIASYATNNAYLDGQGHLVLQAVKTKGGYSSGWVWSKNDVSYGYGTITARIKMPKGQGLAPAFWLMGADSDTVGWPGSGEIDIVEMPSTTTTVYSTVHGPIAGSSNTQQAQIISTLPDLSDDYHNYWVTHLENRITFGVDNQTLGTITPDSLEPGETWVYNRPMYIMLNLSVGGSWAGSPNGSTVFPAKMIVDSVQWEPAL